MCGRVAQSETLLLHMLDGKLQSEYLTSGYRSSNEAAAKRKPAGEEVDPPLCQAHHPITFIEH